LKAQNFEFLKEKKVKVVILDILCIQLSTMPNIAEILWKNDCVAKKEKRLYNGF